MVFLRGVAFADSDEPVAIAVLDGTGDRGSISLYVTENGAIAGCIATTDVRTRWAPSTA